MAMDLLLDQQPVNDAESRHTFLENFIPLCATVRTDVHSPVVHGPALRVVHANIKTDDDVETEQYADYNVYQNTTTQRLHRNDCITKASPAAFQPVLSLVSPRKNI